MIDLNLFREEILARFLLGESGGKVVIIYSAEDVFTIIDQNNEQQVQSVNKQVRVEKFAARTIPEAHQAEVLHNYRAKQQRELILDTFVDERNRLNVD